MLGQELLLGLDLHGQAVQVDAARRVVAWISGQL
jgi:hypothetical protein